MAKDVSLAWRFVKGRGVWATLRVLAQLFGHGRRDWIVTEGLLPGPPPEPDPGGIVFREATDEDLGYLDSLTPHRRPEVLRARIRDDGCLLYVARDGRRIVAFRLVGPAPTHYARFLRLDQFLQLAGNDLFVHEVFTHPDYRNRGIGRRLSLASDQLLVERGCRRHVSLIRIRNLPSLRMAFRKGTRPILHISSVGFLFFRRYRVSRTMPARVLAVLAQATRAPDRP